MNSQIPTETNTHGSKNDREIVDAKVIVTCPGRNFVTLKITTRSGVYGLGDATLNGRELAVASYLQDHVVPNLIGRDAGASRTSGSSCTAARTGAAGRSR
jgi:L-alanine-DL-glutamate epimerase and related enzymes of enolase superfamily